MFYSGLLTEGFVGGVPRTRIATEKKIAIDCGKIDRGLHSAVPEGNRGGNLKAAVFGISCDWNAKKNTFL